MGNDLRLDQRGGSFQDHSLQDFVQVAEEPDGSEIVSDPSLSNDFGFLPDLGDVIRRNACIYEFSDPLNSFGAKIFELLCFDVVKASCFIRDNLNGFKQGRRSGMIV